MDWLDLLAVQGTLKSLFQHHSSKASILWCSAFFIRQLSHPYMTTGKTIALTRWIFAGKIMSVFFNMLSRLVIAFLPRSKCLLISWLQSPLAVIRGPKINSVTVYIVSLSICHEVMGSDAMIFVFLKLSFKPAFFTLLFHFHQDALQSLFASCHQAETQKPGGICISEVLIFLPAILIPAYVSSNLAFRMMYSAYKLNKQGDNI